LRSRFAPWKTLKETKLERRINEPPRTPRKDEAVIAKCKLQISKCKLEEKANREPPSRQGRQEKIKEETRTRTLRGAG
jgi:hypothetical protein